MNEVSVAAVCKGIGNACDHAPRERSGVSVVRGTGQVLRIRIRGGSSGTLAGELCFSLPSTKPNIAARLEGEKIQDSEADVA